MMPFGGSSGRMGRARMRLDEMDCADIMMKAVQRKRSRSIARRESFSGTDDDLKKFRDAVEANEKESKDLQKDIEEYAMKVKELRGDSEQDVKHSDDSFGKPQTEIINANKSSAVTINNYATEITVSKNHESVTHDLVADTKIERFIAINDGSAAISIENESLDETLISRNEDDTINSTETCSIALDKEVEDPDRGTEIESAISKNIDIIDDHEDSNKNFENQSEESAYTKNDEELNGVPNKNIDIVEEVTNNNDTDVNEHQTLQVPDDEENPNDENQNNERIDTNINDFDEHQAAEIADDEENPIDEKQKNVKEETNNNEHQTLNVQVDDEIHQDGNLKNENNSKVQASEERMSINQYSCEQERLTDTISGITDKVEGNESIFESSKQADFDCSESVIEETCMISEIVNCDHDADDTFLKEDGTSQSCIKNEEDVHKNESLEMVNDHSYAVQQIDEDENLEFQIKEQERGSDVEEKNVDQINNCGSNMLEQSSEIITQNGHHATVEVSNEPQESNFLSIVDRIKNDITTLKTISKQGTTTAVNVYMQQVEKETTKIETKEVSTKSIEHSNVETILKEKLINKDVNDDTEVENGKLDHKKSGLKVALDRVYREKSASHIQIPKELSSHLLNLSSANISEQLKKSCSNIVAHMDQEMSKEFLLKKLEELLKQEKKQVTEDLKRRMEQLKETKANHAKEMKALAEKQKCQIQNLHQNHSKKLSKLENRFLDDMENLKKEIELLENEKENMKTPNLIINDCLTASSRF